VQILEELEGGGAAAAEPGGRAGRLAFTGSGTDQRQQWERVARLEAAALAGDSDMGSDEVRNRRVVVKGCVRQIVGLVCGSPADQVLLLLLAFRMRMRRQRRSG
jgi:hypothetical protein